MGNCKCCIKNGSDSLDFLIPSLTDGTYQLGLTHYTCGGRKMLLNDVMHPVTSSLDVVLIGTPIDLGGGEFCQECQITGTVTYKPCGCCEPRTEYVSKQLCLPCATSAVPKIVVNGTVASPKPITYYENNGCGCCTGTYSSTNQIAITTSITVS